MRVLLDTHSFMWFVLNDPNLGRQAKLTIESPINEVRLSPVSYWEIAIKISVGRYRLNRPFEDFWQIGMRDNNIGVLPIELGHTNRLLSLPFHHKDPFDRMLVAQALLEQIPLVSGDAALDAYGVQRIW